MLDKDQIPVLVKHAALAIFINAKGLGGGRRRYLAAMSIARASLTKAGYLRRGSDKKGLNGRVVLTAKGVERDRLHKGSKDVGRKLKSRAFDALHDFVTGHGKLRDAMEAVKKAKAYSGKKRRAPPARKRVRKTRSKKTKRRTKSTRTSRAKKPRARRTRRR